MSFKSKLIFSLLVSTAAISIANAQHETQDAFEASNLPRVASSWDSHSSFGELEDVTEEFEAREEAKNLEQAIGGLKSQAQKYIADGKSEDDVLAIGQNIASLTEQLFAIREKFEGGKLVNAHRQVSQSSVDELLKEKNALSKSTSSIEKGHEGSLEATSLKKSKSETFGDKFVGFFSSKKTSQLKNQAPSVENLQTQESVDSKAVSQNHQNALFVKGEEEFYVIDLNGPSLPFAASAERSKTVTENHSRKRNLPEKALSSDLTKGKIVHVNGNSVVVQEEVLTSAKEKIKLPAPKLRNQPEKALPLSLTKGKIVHVKDNSVVLQEEVQKSPKDSKVALQVSKKKAKIARLIIDVKDTPLAESSVEEVVTDNPLTTSKPAHIQNILDMDEAYELQRKSVSSQFASAPTPAKNISFFEKIKESKAFAWLEDQKEQFVKVTAPIRTSFKTVIEKAKGTTAFQLFKGLFN